MRMRLVSTASFVLLSALAACGDDSGTVFIDASVPDAVPAPPDAPPFECTDPPDDCGGVCVDLDSDEATCGDCDTSCTGGEYCNGGNCECPEAFVAADPSFLFEQIEGSQIPDTVIGIGVFSNGGGHVLATAYSTLAKGGTEVDVEYTFDADPLTMPLLGAGYNVNVQTQQLDSAFAATAGTITFTEICDVGFSGTAANVTFSGVESLFNPVIVPGGCTFTVESVTFSYGEPCPAP